MTGWWQDIIRRGFLWSPRNTYAHSGTDLVMPVGSPIQSPVDGTVIHSAVEPWGGQVDILAHGVQGYPDPVVLSFLHLSREDVSNGPVSVGQQIGLSGQPPPGGPYGDGAHLHFEMTAGDKAPYVSGYSPHTPTASSYPIDAAPFLSRFDSSGIGPGILGGTQAQGAEQVGVQTANALGSIAQSITNVTQEINPALKWLSDPVRIFKLVVGWGLMLAGLFLAFLPDAAEAGVTAAGFPELAPLAGKLGAKAQGPKIRFAPTAREAQNVLARQREENNRAERRQAITAVATQVRKPRPKPEPKPTPQPPIPRPLPRPAGFSASDLRQQSEAAGAKSGLRQSLRTIKAKRETRTGGAFTEGKTAQARQESSEESTRRTFLAGDKTAFKRHAAALLKKKSSVARETGTTRVKRRVKLKQMSADVARNRYTNPRDE